MVSQTRTATLASTYSDVVKVTRKLQADLFAIVDTYGHITEEYALNLIGDLRTLMDEDVLDWVRFLWMPKGSDEVVFAYAYRVFDGESGLVDDRSGGIRYRSHLDDCDFTIRISYSDRWKYLSEDERNGIHSRCHFPWGPGRSLRYHTGSWTPNRTYTSNGYGLDRSSFGG